MHDHDITEEHADASKFLSFRLGDETYAFPIGRVWEIIDFTGVTRVPQTPEYMLGVINLRGGVVPVIDMHQRFGRKAAERTVDTCVIIIDVMVDGESVMLGAVADSVEEVVEIDAAEIESGPRLGNNVNSEFIQGMGRRGDRFILILDIDKLFAMDEATAAHAS